MASTYVWQDAINVTKPFIKSIPTTTIDVTVCDQLNSFLWRSYPWRWAQASLTSASGVLTLVNGTQDYGIGTTTGGGFYQLLRCRITRTDTSPVIVREKDIVNWLAPNLETQGAVDSVEAMAVIQTTVGTPMIRMDRAAAVTGSATYQIDGEYWFQPVKITSTASTIVFPDLYFNVVIEGLKWKYYQLGDDSRAGTMTIDPVSKRYQGTGQAAVFLTELYSMVDQEDWGDAQTTRFPADTLGVRDQSNPGLFGFS